MVDVLGCLTHPMMISQLRPCGCDQMDKRGTEDAATTVQHRRPRIHFDADGLGLEDRTALDYVMWSFPINFIPAILNGTNPQLQGRQAELTRAEFWKYIGCLLMMCVYDFGANS